MENQESVEKLTSLIIEKLDVNNIYIDLEIFKELHRYSGSPDGEKAVDIIVERMSELSILVVRETYSVYRSLPISGELIIELNEESVSFPITPYVYSQSATVAGDIIMDRYSFDQLPYEQHMEVERFSAFKEKIVFTRDDSFKFAFLADFYGAKGVISVWSEDIVHHGTMGKVWGNPEMDDLYTNYLSIPYGELTLSQGEALEKIMKKQNISGNMTVVMDESIYNSSMPIATIKGKSDSFVLVSGHYDSWYEGITDNAVANAAMMELARVIKQQEALLERSVVFAWWSGHSDGRYAGSTWYMDEHFKELEKLCVAHVNMDICGCNTSNFINMSASLMEGEAFHMDILNKFNTTPSLPPVAMGRFADQSFWGVGVPFTVMPRFTVKDAVGRPFYWWHSPEDSIDKVSLEVILRDTEIVAALTAAYLNADRLPADFMSFLQVMKAEIQLIDESTSEDFNVEPMAHAFDSLEKAIRGLMKALDDQKDTDSIIKAVAGELTRLTYTAGSRYHQDLAIDYGCFPKLAMAKNQYRENTTPANYLALQTQFKRQVNRLVGEMKYIEDRIELELFRWKN